MSANQNPEATEREAREDDDAAWDAVFAANPEKVAQIEAHVLLGIRIEDAKRALRKAVRAHRRAVDADVAMRAVIKCEAALLHAAKAQGHSEAMHAVRARAMADVAGIVEGMRRQSDDTVRAIGRAWSSEQQASANGVIGVHSPHLFSLAERCHDAPIAALLAKLREAK